MSKKVVTVEARYFVCVDGIPVGHSMNQAEAGELRQSFPFNKRGNYFKDEFEAESYAEAMREYIAEVSKLPPDKNKRRSASTWSL